MTFLLAALWMLTGCSTHLRYEPVAFELPPIPLDHALLVHAVRNAQERGRIGTIRRRTSEGVTEIGPDRLEILEPAELYVLIATAGRWSRGAELDMMVRRPEVEWIDLDGDSVTLWVGRDGSVTVASGDTPIPWRIPPSHSDVGRWKAEIAETYALDGFSGPWALQELAFVLMALEALTEEERTALVGVRLVRLADSPRRPSEMAWYGPSTDPPRLEVYDAAFQEYGHGFVGPLDRPMPTPVMTLLHEFGHAVVDRPLRDTHAAWRRARDASERMVDPARFQAAYDRATVLRSCYRGLGDDGPVIEAYRAVRGRVRGPTTYGWRGRHHESFAEAFALHHLDPDALRRVMPDVAAWFEDEKHVETGRNGGGCLEPPSP